MKDLKNRLIGQKLLFGDAQQRIEATEKAAEILLEGDNQGLIKILEEHKKREDDPAVILILNQTIVSIEYKMAAAA